MQTSQTLFAIMLAAALALGVLGGCEREGPAERAGKSIDNAAERAGDKVENAGDKIQDAARKD